MSLVTTIPSIHEDGPLVTPDYFDQLLAPEFARKLVLMSSEDKKLTEPQLQREVEDLPQSLYHKEVDTIKRLKNAREKNLSEDVIEVSLDIKYVIQLLERMLQRVQMKLNDPSVLEEIERFSTDAKIEIKDRESFLKIIGLENNDLQVLKFNQEYRLPILTWYLNSPESIFYRIGGVIMHDLAHLFHDPFFTMEHPVIGHEFKRNKFLKQLTALIVFLKILLEVEEKDTSNDVPISVQEFRKTIVSNVEIEVDFDYFEGIEEFISVRTLVLNAITAGEGSGEKATKITIKKSIATDLITYTVGDNVPLGDGWKGYLNELDKAFEKGYKFYDMPGIEVQRGGAIAAFLAGQRSGLYERQYKTKIKFLKVPDPNKKIIQVTFPTREDDKLY